MQAGHVRQVQQRHARFFRQAVALVAVAGAAGSDAVHPGVLSAARGGNDVLAGQVIRVKVPAAVGADMAVAHEELGIGERRGLPPGPAGNGPAHGNDRVHLDARLLASAPLHATSQHVERIAQRPGDAIAGVEHSCFFGRKPGLGSP